MKTDQGSDDVIRTDDDLEKITPITSEGEAAEDVPTPEAPKGDEEADTDANAEAEESADGDEEKPPTPTDTAPAASAEPEKLEIDGTQYTREELEAIFATGKSIKEYQKAHPGWDPFLMERDYRHKTDELNRLKAQGAKAPEPTKPETASDDDLKDIHPDDVKKMERVFRAKGFVTKQELTDMERQRQTQTYEQVKAAQVKAFTDKYPEYRRDKDPNDVRWNTLLKEFSLYKLPQDPRQIGELLERAHKQIAPASSRDIDPKKAAQILAQQKANRASTERRSGAAPASGAPAKTVPKGDVATAAKYLKGFSEEEIKEIMS